MSRESDAQNQIQLDCSICLSEIPPSVANSLEGPDYVFFYFGPSCYELWQRSRSVTDSDSV